MPGVLCEDGPEGFIDAATDFELGFAGHEIDAAAKERLALWLAI